MVELFANSGDPDQTPQFAASDLGLHCLPATLLGISRLQLAKHLTAKRVYGRDNVVTTPLRCHSDIEMTLLMRCVLTGICEQ